MKRKRANCNKCFYTFIEQQSVEMNMSSGQNSSDFLDETIGSIAASKKVPKVEELLLERPVYCEKLVLRC